jgi:hypothetical protein
MNDAALQRFDDGLRPIGHIKPVEDQIDVPFHGRFGDAQCAADFLVAAPVRNQLQYFDFAPAQL